MPQASGVRPPTRDEWRRLYQAAQALKALAPWAWLEEDDLFGVQDPESGQLGFVSVMGMLGEHYAASLYLGAEGLYGFWRLQMHGPFMTPETLFEIPQLQASFEDRDQLDEHDRRVIKDLGLRFRGRQAWPLFRSYRPGFLPWRLEAHEARFLTHALEQLANVAVRAKNDPELLTPEDDEVYLVRVPRREGDTLVWEDEARRVPPPEGTTITSAIDKSSLELLKGLPPGRHTLEIDLFMFPAPIAPKGERPYFPYMLMIVEAQSGMIVANELLEPLPSLQAMWEGVLGAFLTQLAKLELRPATVRARSPLLLDLLEYPAYEVGFALEASDELPGIDEAREALKGFLS